MALFGTATAQRVSRDRRKQDVRSILISGHPFNLSGQHCEVSLSAFASNNCDTIYTIDVNAYLNNTDSCKLTFTLFDDEEIALYMDLKAEGYNNYFGPTLMGLLFDPTIIRRFIITKEQLDKLFDEGILGIELSDGIDIHWHSWKKDKLGTFLKKSYDLIQERFKKQK